MNEMVVIKNNEIIVDATVIEKIKDFKKAKAQMDLVEKELNKSLKEAMEYSKTTPVASSITLTFEE